MEDEQTATTASPLPTTVPSPIHTGIPSWLVEVIDILESIWNALPQSHTAGMSDPDHPVAQKIAALKSKLPTE